MKRPKMFMIVLTLFFNLDFKYALRAKFTSSVPSKTHWLDNAKGKYTESEISDTRSALSVICVFTAYPVFWSLYEQPVLYLPIISISVKSSKFIGRNLLGGFLEGESPRN